MAVTWTSFWTKKKSLLAHKCLYKPLFYGKHSAIFVSTNWIANISQTITKSWHYFSQQIRKGNNQQKQQQLLFITKYIAWQKVKNENYQCQICPNVVEKKNISRHFFLKTGMTVGTPNEDIGKMNTLIKRLWITCKMFK